MSFNIRCHKCSSWMGESREPMELVGLFKTARGVEQVADPRDTWRCKCGWSNVFEPKTGGPNWRDMETKTPARSA